MNDTSTCGESTRRPLAVQRAMLLLSLILTLVFALTITGCAQETEQPAQTPEQTEPPTEPEATPESTATQGPGPIEEVTELRVEDLEVGTGAEAKAGDTVTVHYTGWLADGTMFESSLNSGQPFTFQLGAGQVIEGWDEGVAGMNVGGKRRLFLPPDKAYGAQGSGPIPPNASLVFDVELLSVE